MSSKQQIFLTSGVLVLIVLSIGMSFYYTTRANDQIDETKRLVLEGREIGNIRGNATLGAVGDISMIASAGAGLFAKVGFDRAKKSEEIAKETMGAEVQTKNAVKELASVTYENMPQKGNEITDAPSVQLETLNNDAKELADKAAKA